MIPKTLIPMLLTASSAQALEVPSNLRDFYNQLKSKGSCDDKLATGLFNSAMEEGDMSYCGDHLDDYGVVYLQGPGKFSNMDVDCDGVQGGPQDDGRCDESQTTQTQTAVRDIIQEYDVGISDLNPHEHSFVVFGNTGSEFGSDRTFDPQKYGVEKASVMAVVCGDKMFYGVWGDSNGDDGERPSVGEVSISLATACYGKGMSAGDGANTSHNDPDVLYIAFTGSDAVPGADGAEWAAGNFDDFHDSLVDLGDKLVQRIGGNGGGDDGDDDGDDDDDDCSWEGHCAGATCDVAQDCADDLTCIDGECA